MAKRRYRLRWWIAGGTVAFALLAAGGPFVYIHFIEGSAPAKLSLGGSGTSATGTSTSSSPTGASAAGGITGTWKVSAGSIAGYRVQEVLIGQNSTAVGRTTDISGSINVTGSELSSANFTVDMATVKSDQSERNTQFDGRIMDVSTYPTATFHLTHAVALDGPPAVGTSVHYTATGKLTMHGSTKTVTFPLSAERTSGGIEVLADINIVFSNWDISNPSIGGFVTTANHGTLEVLLDLTRGSGNAAVTAKTPPATGSSPPGGGAITVPKTTIPSLSIPTQT